MKGLETEVKIAVPSLSAFRRNLRMAGFRIKRRRVFERNTIFETDPPTLRPSGRILRLREAGGKCLLTYKGPATISKHKSREEIEFLASDSEAAYTFLSRLGYQAKFIYEKFRTEFCDSASQGIITVDETPIGNYAELEGTEKWIDSTAKSLGIADTQYITASYGALYLQWCEQQGVNPTHMKFG